MSNALSLLRHRSFLLLWSGLLVSSLGDWVNFVAMLTAVYNQTHSVVMLAVLRLCHIVPSLVVAPLAGVYIDRWNRKYTLIASSVGAGLAVGALVFYHPVVAVCLAEVVITVATVFFEPALSASLPNIVSEEQLVSANSLSQVTDTASTVFGGLAGGIVVAQLGASTAFLLDAVSFTVIAVLITFVHIRPSAPVLAATMREGLGEGIDYLRQHPAVATVVAAGAIFVLAPGTVFTLGVAFVQTGLHGDAAQYGVILAAQGIGAGLGAAAAVAYRRRLVGIVTFAASGAVVGLGVAGLGLSATLPTAALMYGIAGFASMINTVAGVTLLQNLVPDRFRGRIFAVAHAFNHVGVFVSAVVVGLVGSVIGAGEMIAVSGGIACVMGVTSLGVAWLRR